MVLTNETLEAINNPKTRVALAFYLGKTEQWISRLIEQNKNNGLLTTAEALVVIEKETGFKQSQILKDESL
ncbi:MAG: hypothetical protein WKF97_08360 [Chitinophagaceae bacterium]